MVFDWTALLICKVKPKTFGHGVGGFVAPAPRLAGEGGPLPGGTFLVLPTKHSVSFMSVNLARARSGNGDMDGALF